MRKLKIVLLYAALLCLGSALGFAVANFLISSDYKADLNIIRSVNNGSSDVYAVKRLPAEANCVGNEYVFYSNGFIVADLRFNIGSQFSISTAVPTKIKMKRGCSNRHNNEALCTSLLGAYPTVPIPSIFPEPNGETSHLPVSGERKDELFEKIIALKSLNSSFHFAGQRPEYNLQTGEEEYHEVKPTEYQYGGAIGVATVESTYARYELREKKEKITEFYTWLISAGGFVGLLMAFGVYRIWMKPKQN